MNITKQNFGQRDGKPVDLYTLENSGVTVKITNYGATITDVVAPDKNGKAESVVLGYDDPTEYYGEANLKGNFYFGCVVGRYGNRIADGKFTLNGKTYSLAINNGPNHLHGGVKGFDKKVWDGKEIKTADTVGVELKYSSPDGEENYPGKLDVAVTYTLNGKGELLIDYKAKTDKDTIINLTNHTYFNLAIGEAPDAMGHMLQIEADKYLEASENMIPVRIADVKGTPFDFTTPHTLAQRIDEKNKQLEIGAGYDHCYVLRGQDGKLTKAAEAWHPLNGRKLEVFTTQPGVQLYSSNWTDGTLGRNGHQFVRRYAFCLETQHYPDSPNQSHFPSTVLKTGDTYHQQTVFKFSVKK